jgi:ribosomal protein S18 acetylase RimI-like enzyme
MDHEGRRYVQDMRLSGNDNSFIQWANRAAESTSLPLTGYIWEENGKVVGNVSLVPFRHNKQRVYLIANVAVHPDYRRHGIARALTERAMLHAREKTVTDVWLHVREDNPAAIALYENLGFAERARRTAWFATTDANAELPAANLRIVKRNARDWETQRSWLARLYPDFLVWHRHWNFNVLKPGFWNWLYLAFIDMNIRQWVALQDEKMEAALAWIPYGARESLFAAVDETSNPKALTTLLIQARRDLFQQYSRVAFDFPKSKFDPAIEAAGFKPTRTLIWMQANL